MMVMRLVIVMVVWLVICACCESESTTTTRTPSLISRESAQPSRPSRFVGAGLPLQAQRIATLNSLADFATNGEWASWLRDARPTALSVINLGSAHYDPTFIVVLGTVEGGNMIRSVTVSPSPPPVEAALFVICPSCAPPLIAHVRLRRFVLNADGTVSEADTSLHHVDDLRIAPIVASTTDDSCASLPRFRLDFSQERALQRQHPNTVITWRELERARTAVLRNLVIIQVVASVGECPGASDSSVWCAGLTVLVGDDLETTTDSLRFAVYGDENVANRTSQANSSNAAMWFAANATFSSQPTITQSLSVRPLFFAALWQNSEGDRVEVASRAASRFTNRSVAAYDVDIELAANLVANSSYAFFVVDGTFASVMMLRIRSRRRSTLPLQWERVIHSAASYRTDFGAVAADTAIQSTSAISRIRYGDDEPMIGSRILAVAVARSLAGLVVVSGRSGVVEFTTSTTRSSSNSLSRRGEMQLCVSVLELRGGGSLGAKPLLRSAGGDIAGSCRSLSFFVESASDFVEYLAGVATGVQQLWSTDLVLYGDSDGSRDPAVLVLFSGRAVPPALRDHLLAIDPSNNDVPSPHDFIVVASPGGAGDVNLGLHIDQGSLALSWIGASSGAIFFEAVTGMPWNLSATDNRNNNVPDCYRDGSGDVPDGETSTKSATVPRPHTSSRSETLVVANAPTPAPTPAPLGDVPPSSDSVCQPEIRVFFAANGDNEIDAKYLKVSRADQLRSLLSQAVALVRSATSAPVVADGDGGPISTPTPPTQSFPLPLPDEDGDFTDDLLETQERSRFVAVPITNITLIVEITSPHYFRVGAESSAIVSTAAEWRGSAALPDWLTFSAGELGRRGGGEPGGFVAVVTPRLRSRRIAASITNETDDDPFVNFTTAALTNLPPTFSEADLRTLAEVDPSALRSAGGGATLPERTVQLAAWLLQKSTDDAFSIPDFVQEPLLASVISRRNHKQMEISIPFSRGFLPILDELVRVTVSMDAIQQSPSCVAQTVRGAAPAAVDPSATFLVRTPMNPNLANTELLILPAASVALALALVSGSGGGLGTALGDIQALAFLGQLHCSRSDVRLLGRDVAWFVSPLFDFGVEAVALGGVAIPLAIALVHAAVIAAFYMIKPPSSNKKLLQLCASLRFPAVPLTVASICFQGLLLATAFLVFNVESFQPSSESATADSSYQQHVAAAESHLYLVDPASDNLAFGAAPTRGARIVVLLVGFTAFLAVPYGCASLYRTFVQPAKRRKYESFDDLFHGVPAFLRLFVLPTGYWRPQELTSTFGPCFAAMRPQREYFTIAPYLASIVIFLAGMFNVDEADPKFCVFQLATIAVLLISVAAVIGAAFPFRLKMKTYFAVASLVLLGGTVVCDAVGAQHAVPEISDVKAALLFAFVVLTLVRAATEAVFVVIDKTVWRRRMRELFLSSDDEEGLAAAMIQKSESAVSADEQQHMRPLLTTAALHALNADMAIERDAVHLVDILFETCSDDESEPPLPLAAVTLAAPAEFAPPRRDRSAGDAKRRRRKRVSDILRASRTRTSGASPGGGGGPTLLRTVDPVSGKTRLRYVSDDDDDDVEGFRRAGKTTDHPNVDDL